MSYARGANAKRAKGKSGRWFYPEGDRGVEGIVEFVSSLQGETCASRVLPPREAEYGPWPQLDPRLIETMASRGIERPYSHQARAISAALSGRDTVIVTPTASGKTLCYNLPVINAVLERPESRAIYIFPTKALAQDQLAELHGVIETMDLDIRTFTYDGDTPPDARAKIRDAGHVVITNPDMLHTGILPHHTKWRHLFENLRYIVIDELHSYRGIFGSHFALILSRLQRICEFYGSRPSFICCSATIANPRELAEALTGRDFDLIDESGAPSGERHIIFYNPPVMNSRLGIRRSALAECVRIAGEAVARGIRTIVFTRSRINVELILKYLREAARSAGGDAEAIKGYRGGYLPNERRAIERGLRDGSVRCVVSTNALELGVDIGSLELAVLHGYPGSVASAWQQMGRAGRRAGDGRASAAIMVASSLPLDQFLSMNPDYFFGASPEHARINPTNPYVQIGHIKCSAFELPFKEGERLEPCDTEEALGYLARQGVLHEQDGVFHWQEDSYPAVSLSLRSATSENFVIQDVTDPSRPIVIGQMDRRSAPTLIFPQAIYFHHGEPYQVQELDHERMRCMVRRVDADYYTDADAAARIEVLDEFDDDEPSDGVSIGWGEALLATKPTVYKKIKLFTHENVGYGNIHLPEEQMHTTAYWINLPQLEGKGRDERAEQVSGMSHLLRVAAPLWLMCAAGDIIVYGHERDPHFGRPTIFAADNVPGGVGLAEALFDMGGDLFRSCLDAITRCRCDAGCPACVGATLAGSGAKASVRRLLERLI